MSRALDRYRVVLPGNAPAWAQQLESEINSVLLRMARDTRLKRFELGRLPKDGSEHQALYFTGGAAPKPVYFDGIVWRYYADDSTAPG